jgi:CubicO group peptidase (beta-lactamase class C family)
LKTCGIRTIAFLCALLAATAVVCFAQNSPAPQATDSTAADSGDYFPGKDWELASPESQGYSSKKLEVLRAWLAVSPTQSMVILANGHMIFSYGDTAHLSKIASERKSVLSMLYGVNMKAVEKPLDETVEELGLAEPDRPFLPIEKTATLIQLLACRSGIYLSTEDPHPERDLIEASEPRRGSEYPGLYFHYNGFDFNAAGTAFEKITGKNIYDALQKDLAEPLAFQDFDRSRQAKVTPPKGEAHAEYAMYLSTRDMARLGLLMLRKGNWNGKQIIVPEWVQASTSIWTPFEEMNPSYLRALGAPERWGFGLMWWVWDASSYPGDKYFLPFQGAFEARGTGGQFITVLPARQLVLVHKVDIDPYPRGALDQQGWDTITNMVISAACGACK